LYVAAIVLHPDFDLNNTGYGDGVIYGSLTIWHFPIFAAMNMNDDLQARWWKLEERLIERFEKKPDVESILFLIGIQELGDIKKKFTKEQKQDLMHIAICTILSPSGFYELARVDEEGWPHFNQLKPMPEMLPHEQENFLKDHILLYFQNNGGI
jgi:hypothetical protein